MTEFPIPQDEVVLKTLLRDLEILDAPPEQDFDQIAILAGMLCQTSISLIGFPVQDKTWIKSNIGLDLPADLTIPALFKGLTAPLVITDTDADSQFAGNLFIKLTGIKFIAVVPLLNERGESIGHLAVADNSPKAVTDTQIQGLQMLANQVMNLLKLRKLKLDAAQQSSILSGGLEEIESIFQTAVDAVFITDDQGIVCSWNSKAEELFGWTALDAVGQKFHHLLIPERNHLSFLKITEQYMLEGLPKQRFEFVTRRKDFSEFTATLGISPTYVHGKCYFILFAKAVEDRRSINRELEIQKSFYENILNKIPTDIAVFDINHRYMFLNPGAIKDDVLRKKIIGMDDFEYFKFRGRDDKVPRQRRAQFLEAKTTGKVVKFEDTVKNPQGQTITHLRRLFPVHEESGAISMFIGFGIDITDRKVLEEKQSVMMKQLSAQNTQLLDFCNIVSHNLRGPLINMAMLVEFIDESDDVDEIKILTSKLNPVIESLNTTFNELVESIQVRQDNEVASEDILLVDYLQRTLDGLDMEIKKTGAEIIVDFDDAPVVNYPPKYLNSIFHNLVSNAIKYHAPERKPVIHISTRKNVDSILLIVKDNGLGLDLNKHKDNIFKIGKVFHKHPNAKGLGLYMTKTQIEAMDGKIWVESAPNEGATFYIVFTNQH
jgi:PAS domain S-box-containing protein